MLGRIMCLVVVGFDSLLATDYGPLSIGSFSAS